MKPLSWIVLLAYEARIRHAADCRRERETAKQSAAVHTRVLVDLCGAIAVDIEAFIRANGNESQLALTRETTSPRGFVVSRTDDAFGSRRLVVDLEERALSCRYTMCGRSLNGACDQQVLAIEFGNGGAALSLWNGGDCRTFATLAVLSEFLLAPIVGDR